MKKTSGQKNRKNKKAKNNIRFSFGKLLFTLFGIAAFTGIIVVGYVFFYMYSFVTGEVAIDLDEYQSNQSQTSIIYAYDENGDAFELQRLHGTENRIYVGLEEIPKHLQNAFIALEDARFPKHNGVDWIRFVAVFVKDKLSTGGSSITQQLVKNLTDERAANFVRKFKEICYALNLERNFDKDEILEAYLNTLYLGSGCYGVKTACEVYFGKDVSEINVAEAACIASITKAPTKFNPLLNPDNNRKRQVEDCLDAMLQEGYLTPAEYNEALAYEMVFTNSENYVPDEEEKKKEEEQSEVWSYYVDYIVDSLYDLFMTEYDMTERQATQKIYYGGLQIYSAVDLRVQSILEDVYYNRKTFPDESGKDVKAQSSMTIMDYSGRIVGIIGGAGKKTQNRSLNRAADSPRQPGSSIKPISVYGPAIDLGFIHWSTLIKDYAISYQGKLWPQNQGGSKGSGNLVTVQNALARSLNTVPARIVTETIKLNNSFDYLTNHFMISTANSEKDISPAPLATGAMTRGITTLEMTAAYATFGNGGLYYDPYCYYLVTNSDGTTVYFDSGDVQGERVLKESTAGVMCELLQSVTTSSYGTGTKYKVEGFPTMAKTGTTSDDYDRWFVGGTPYYVAAVWYGYDLNKSVSNVSGNPAGKLFKKVMDEVHEELDDKQFIKSNLVEEKKYCARTGLIAGKNCYSTGLGWFAIDNLPDVCNKCYKSSSGSSNGSSGSGTTSPVQEQTTQGSLFPEWMPIN